MGVFYACRETGSDRAAYNRAAKEVLEHIRTWKSLDSNWRTDWNKIKALSSWIDYGTIREIETWARHYNISL